MSNNNVPDLGEMLKFWELKKEIVRHLNYGLDALFIVYDGTSQLQVVVSETLSKIESIGKKENE